MFGEETALQVTDLPVGVLAALAFASIGIYGIVLGGWASGSTYPLLGGLRSSAQMISYEVAMGLSFVAVFLYAGTLSTSAIVYQQESGWYIWLLPVSFVIYVIAMVGETNRAPFDLPEAESELVGGFNTEYSSMRFGLFFLGEYINMINVSAIAVTLFLGGWRAPWPLSEWDAANTGYLPMLWFVIKLLMFLFFFVWLRGTLPRIRYDQFMHMGWKVHGPGLVGLDRADRHRARAEQRHRPDHRRGAAVDGRSAGRHPADRRVLAVPQGDRRRWRRTRPWSTSPSTPSLTGFRVVSLSRRRWAATRFRRSTWRYRSRRSRRSPVASRRAAVTAGAGGTAGGTTTSGEGS